MKKVYITENTLKEAISKSLEKHLNEDTEEKLGQLFAANEKWHRLNPTLPGDKNPYPGQIWHAFARYYFKHYMPVISYDLPWKKERIRFKLSKDEVLDCLYHTFFDYTSIDDCKYRLESDVKNYYEERVYDRINEKPDEYLSEIGEFDINIKLESVPK